MSQKKPSATGEVIRTVIYAGAIAIAVRTFAYEPFNIPSGSMIPTLLIGDYLFVSKFSYGYSRHSLPFSLPLISGRILASEPERGDVAVFKLPADNRTDYIKRIIGLPGDRIQVVKGILHINGKPVRRDPAAVPYTLRRGNRVQSFDHYVETLPNGRRHEILELSDNEPSSDNTQEYKVPDGHFFAMGDNRDNSSDSRYLGRVGFVPRENLVGRAEFLFFSVDGSGWKFWQWPWTIRFSRLFQGVE
jgi:signal peptidase I